MGTVLNGSVCVLRNETVRGRRQRSVNVITGQHMQQIHIPMLFGEEGLVDGLEGDRM
jgi:hypothetical protein